MKKAIFPLLLAVVLGMSACSPSRPTGNGSHTTTYVDVNPQPTIYELDYAVHEYGNTESLLDYGKSFSAAIFYPVSGHAMPDNAIRDWAKETLADFRNFIGTSEDYPGQGMDSVLTVNYNSYRISDSVASVIQHGWFMAPAMAHQSDA